MEQDLDKKFFLEETDLRNELIQERKDKERYKQLWLDALKLIIALNE